MRRLFFAAAMLAFFVSTISHAGSLVEGFSQFAGCQKAAGTWWNTNVADKYTMGHKVNMEVVNGKLHFAVDANPDRQMTPLREVRNITATPQGVEIVTASGTKYMLARKGNLLTGEMHYSSGINKLEFDCNRPA